MITPSYLLLYVVYLLCANDYKILLIHSFVTSKKCKVVSSNLGLYTL